MLTNLVYNVRHCEIPLGWPVCGRIMAIRLRFRQSSIGNGLLRNAFPLAHPTIPRNDEK